MAHAIALSLPAQVMSVYTAIGLVFRAKVMSVYTAITCNHEYRR